MNNTNDEMREIVYEAIERKESEVLGNITIFGLIGLALYLLFGAAVAFNTFVVISIVTISLSVILTIVDKVKERRKGLNKLDKKVEAIQ